MQTILKGKIMDERWASAHSVMYRLQNYINRGYHNFDVRVKDGSDRLCKLVLTTEDAQ